MGGTCLSSRTVGERWRITSSSAVLLLRVFCLDDSFPRSVAFIILRLTLTRLASYSSLLVAGVYKELIIGLY